MCVQCYNHRQAKSSSLSSKKNAANRQTIAAKEDIVAPAILHAVSLVPSNGYDNPTTLKTDKGDKGQAI